MLWIENWYIRTSAKNSEWEKRKIGISTAGNADKESHKSNHIDLDHMIIMFFSYIIIQLTFKHIIYNQRNWLHSFHAIFWVNYPKSVKKKNVEYKNWIMNNFHRCFTLNIGTFIYGCIIAIALVFRYWGTGGKRFFVLPNHSRKL